MCLTTSAPGKKQELEANRLHPRIVGLRKNETSSPFPHAFPDIMINHKDDCIVFLPSDLKQ
jgi:hypothetical protein